MKHALALLTAALALQARADVQILPAGEFKGRDGRPGKELAWKLPDAAGRALAAKLNARHGGGVEFCVCYEHQIELADKNGQPAPASGWAKQFEWRDGEGLFATGLKWTDRAAQMIEAGEYKYLSPTIVYDRDSGDVLDVLTAALVNTPNLNLQPVAQERLAQLNARFFQLEDPTPDPTKKERSMNPVLLALLKRLGLPETDATTAEQAVAAVDALGNRPAVPVALCKALGLADTATAEQADAAVASLKAAQAGDPDPTKWVSLNSFNALNAEVAALRARQADADVEAELVTARAQGKCTPVVENVWREVGKKDLAQLKALIAATPANPALAGNSQTGGKPPVAENADGLSPEQKAICKGLGVKPEDYVATLKLQATA